MLCPRCRVEFPHHKPGCYNRDNERKIREKDLRDARQHREAYKSLKTYKRTAK